MAASPVSGQVADGVSLSSGITSLSTGSGGSAFPSNVTAGNLVVIRVGAGPGSTHSAPTDSLGSTWTQIGTTTGDGVISISRWWAVMPSTGANVITANFSSSTGATIVAVEITGQRTTSPIADGVAAPAQAPAAGSDTVTVGTVALALPATSGLMLAFNFNASGSVGAAGTGFTDLGAFCNIIGANRMRVESKVVSTNAAQTATFQQVTGTDSNYAAVVLISDPVPPALSLVGPVLGRESVQSSDFYASLSGDLSGTVVVTPSDGGAGGTFSPSTVSLSTGSPTGTFRYTPPAGAATRTISTTNDGGLSNPASISFVVQSANAPKNPNNLFRTRYVTTANLARGSTSEASAVLKTFIFGPGAAASIIEAAGTSTASASGASLFTAAAAASGLGTASGSGAASASGVAASAGLSTASAVGVAGISGAASAAGTSTASFIGVVGTSGAASSAGTSTASFVGASTVSATASTAGIGVASGVGAANVSAAAAAAGVGAATGVGAANATAAASAAGVGTAAASGAAQSRATMSAAGTSTVSGVGTFTAGGTTYYVDSAAANDLGSGSIGSPKKYINSGIALLAPGDTLIIKNGTYSNANDAITRAAVVNNKGSSGAWITIKAETDFGVIVTAGLGVAPLGSAPGALTGMYHIYQGIIWDNPIGKGYAATHVKFKNCAFKGAETTGNVATFGIGTNDATAAQAGSFILMEDCLIYGKGGRYRMLVYECDKIVLRRVVARLEDGWNDSGDPGDPSAAFSIYNSTNVELQNCIALDIVAGDTSNLEAAYYHPANTGFNESEVWERGCIAINCDTVGWNWDDAQGITSSGLIDCSAILCPFPAQVNGGGTSPKIVTVTRMTGYGMNVAGSRANLREFGNAANSITLADSVMWNYQNYDHVDQVQTANSNVFYDAAAPGSPPVAGQLSYNPNTNGILYPIRKETGSTAATSNKGATNVNKIGTDGTLWGETGYATTTGNALWPFPNEATYKTLLAASRTIRFTAVGALQLDGVTPVTLTSYIWEASGNAIPAGLYGTSYVMNAAGTSSASATSAALKAASASASGVGTAAAVGRALATAVASAAGSSTVQAAGASLFSTLANAAGVSTATFAGIVASMGNAIAAGASTAVAIGAAQARATMNAAGTSTANAASPGNVDIFGVASASGSSFASAVGAQIAAANANAAGLSNAQAVALALWTVLAQASGTSTASALASVVGLNVTDEVFCLTVIEEVLSTLRDEEVDALVNDLELFVQ